MSDRELYFRHDGNEKGKWMQRSIMWLTIVTLACGWTGAQSQSAQNGFGNYPPAPKPEPLTETVHGVTLNDPYRWMERQDRRDDMLAWIAASSKQTTETLARLPGRAPLLKALEDSSRLSAIHDNVKLVAGRLFFTEIAPGQDIPVLKVRGNGKDRLFLDPMAGASADTHRVISNYAPSPDGTLIAIHLAEGGGEVGSMLFFHVATGKPTGDSLSPIWGEFQVNWIDNKTLTYIRLNSDRSQEDPLQNMTVYLHRIGTPSGTDVPVLGPKVGAGFPMAALEHPHVLTVPHSRWALASGTGARADERIGFASRASLLSGHPRWTQLASYDDKVNGFELVGDTFFYLTTSHDPNGEIRSLHLGKDTLATSHQLLASSGTVLNGRRHRLR